MQALIPLTVLVSLTAPPRPGGADAGLAPVAGSFSLEPEALSTPQMQGMAPAPSQWWPQSAMAGAQLAPPLPVAQDRGEARPVMLTAQGGKTDAPLQDEEPAPSAVPDLSPALPPLAEPPAPDSTELAGVPPVLPETPGRSPSAMAGTPPVPAHRGPLARPMPPAPLPETVRPRPSALRTAEGAGPPRPDPGTDAPPHPVMAGPAPAPASHGTLSPPPGQARSQEGAAPTHRPRVAATTHPAEGQASLDTAPRRPVPADARHPSEARAGNPRAPADQVARTDSPAFAAKAVPRVSPPATTPTPPVSERAALPDMPLLHSQSVPTAPPQAATPRLPDLAEARPPAEARAWNPRPTANQDSPAETAAFTRKAGQRIPPPTAVPTPSVFGRAALPEMPLLRSQSIPASQPQAAAPGMPEPQAAPPEARARPPAPAPAEALPLRAAARVTHDVTPDPQPAAPVARSATEPVAPPTPHSQAAGTGATPPLTPDRPRQDPAPAIGPAKAVTPRSPEENHIRPPAADQPIPRRAAPMVQVEPAAPSRAALPADERPPFPGPAASAPHGTEPPFVPAESPAPATQAEPRPGSPPPAASSHPPPVPVQLARQLALAPPLGERDAPLELTLDPPELGSIRISVSRGPEGLVLHLQADLPETLDLLRRNGAALADELQRQGLDHGSFSFSGGQDGRGRAPPHPVQAPAAAPPPADAALPRPMPARAAGSSLDLRL